MEKRYIKYIIMILVILLVIVIGIVVGNQRKQPSNDDGKFKIVTSFYPVYVMTLNITEGAENIEVVNMADTNAGCIHDYTLTTADMKKIETADVFVQNGLGLEAFIDKVTSSNKGLSIIDSSKEISQTIQEHNEINPHIWTSITNYMKQVENIANGLAEKNPENAEIYQINSEEYIRKLRDLKEKYHTELDLKGKTAITLNETFAYLAKDLEMELTVIPTSHEESTISAETLKNVIDMMKQNHTEIIIVDVGEDLKNAENIAKETGAKIYTIDSHTTGKLSKDAYINSMIANLEILKTK